MKGGSDTITKLLWTCDYNLPNKLIQVHAVARELLLVFVQVHRMHHLAMAKNNLAFYLTLLSYRESHNKKSSFHKTLIAMSHCKLLSSGEHTVAPVKSGTQCQLQPLTRQQQQQQTT